MEIVAIIIALVVAFLLYRYIRNKKATLEETRWAIQERETIENNVVRFALNIDDYLERRITDDAFSEILDLWAKDPVFMPLALGYRGVVLANKMKKLDDRSREFLLLVTYIGESAGFILDKRKFLKLHLSGKSPEVVKLITTEYTLLMMFEPVTLYFYAHIVGYPKNIQIISSLKYNHVRLIEVLEFLFSKKISESMFNKHIQEKIQIFTEKGDAMTDPVFDKI